MRQRPAARLLLVSARSRVLLFRFVHTAGALAGNTYWATPGGGVEEGETFEVAAIRELREETGMEVESVSPAIAERTFVLMLPDGEEVLAIENYFLIDAKSECLSSEGWTENERLVMADYKWWSEEAIRASTETIYPEGLMDMLKGAGAFTGR